MSEQQIERRQPQLTLSEVDIHIDAKLEPIKLSIQSLGALVHSLVANDDFTAHRRFHEQQMKEHEERKNMIKDITKDVAKYVIQGVLLACAAMILLGLQSQVGIWASKGSVDTQRAVPQIVQPQQQGQIIYQGVPPSPVNGASSSTITVMGSFQRGKP